MVDTIYENSHPSRRSTDGTFCFGYVKSVDVTNRVCTVKTFFATSDALNDKHIKNCRWLSADAGPDGDDMTSIPRSDTLALVFFVLGEPFIFGFFRAQNKKGNAAGGAAKIPLTEGDKIIATRAGNYLTVKANGLIQLQCKDTLRMLFLPNKSELLILCRNHEIKTDGGFVSWRSDNALNTLHRALYRKDLAQSMVILEEKGNVSSSLIYRKAIGPGITPGSALSYETTIGVDGTVTTNVGILGQVLHSTVVKPDGSSTVTATGDVSVTTSLGNITAKATAGNITAKATVGSCSMEGSGGKLKLDKGKVGLGGPAGELVDLTTQALQLLIDTCTNMLKETHVGNLGYPTSPPTNSADYAKTVADATLLKAKLKLLAGGV